MKLCKSKRHAVPKELSTVDEFPIQPPLRTPNLIDIDSIRENDLVMRVAEICASDEFADVWFAVGRRDPNREVQDMREWQKIPAHRLVLGCRSPVFAKMLFSGECKKTIDIPDISPHSFLAMLVYVYRGSTTQLQAETVLGTLYAARKYRLPRLVAVCINFVESKITVENACVLLGTSHILGEQEVAQTCFEYIYCHPVECIESESFLSIPVDCLVSIVACDNLVIPEIRLFRTLLKWVEAECSRQNKSASQENKREILAPVLPLIRFPLIPASALATEVTESGILTDEELMSLLVSSASGAKNTTTWIAEPRIEKPAVKDFPLLQKKDDSIGILRYIATVGNTKPWVNPILNNRVVISLSSLQGGNVYDLVSHNSYPVYTKNQEGSWIMFDLGPSHCRLRPRHYTLRHGYSDGSYALSSWVLEGGNDSEEMLFFDQEGVVTTLDYMSLGAGEFTQRKSRNVRSVGSHPVMPYAQQELNNKDKKNEGNNKTKKGDDIVWTVLKRHLEDDWNGLPDQEPYVSHTWAIGGETTFRDPGKFYQYFRLRMIGPNSSGDGHLMLCGVEFYGHAYFSKEPSTWEEPDDIDEQALQGAPDARHDIPKDKLESSPLGRVRNLSHLATTMDFLRLNRSHSYDSIKKIDRCGSFESVSSNSEFYTGDRRGSITSRGYSISEDHEKINLESYLKKNKNNLPDNNTKSSSASNTVSTSDSLNKIPNNKNIANASRKENNIRNATMNQNNETVSDRDKKNDETSEKNDLDSGSKWQQRNWKEENNAKDLREMDISMDSNISNNDHKISNMSLQNRNRNYTQSGHAGERKIGKLGHEIKQVYPNDGLHLGNRYPPPMLSMTPRQFGGQNQLYASNEQLKTQQMLKGQSQVMSQQNSIYMSNRQPLNTNNKSYQYMSMRPPQNAVRQNASHMHSAQPQRIDQQNPLHTFSRQPPHINQRNPSYAHQHTFNQNLTQAPVRYSQLNNKQIPRNTNFGHLQNMNKQNKNWSRH